MVPPQGTWCGLWLDAKIGKHDGVVQVNASPRHTPHVPKTRRRSQTDRCSGQTLLHLPPRSRRLRAPRSAHRRSGPGRQHRWEPSGSQSALSGPVSKRCGACRARPGHRRATNICNRLRGKRQTAALVSAVKLPTLTSPRCRLQSPSLPSMPTVVLTPTEGSNSVLIQGLSPTQFRQSPRRLFVPDSLSHGWCWHGIGSQAPPSRWTLRRKPAIRRCPGRNALDHFAQLRILMVLDGARVCSAPAASVCAATPEHPATPALYVLAQPDPLLH